jgi:hypothetical protein
MKYFTPQLCARGNSDDPEVIDRVEDAWEDAIKRYDRHYKKIERQFPEAFRRFNKEQCLHDADFDGPVMCSRSPCPGARATL